MRPDCALRVAHGLRIASALDIDGVELATTAARDTESNVDLEIATIDHLPNPAADAQEILGYEFDNGQFVKSVVADDGSTLVTFSDLGRFRLSPDLRCIELALRDTDNQGIAAVLLQGWVMSMALMLRGHVVLHASAVEVDGKAIALLADSGMGKSTLTAMLIRDGAELVSDDVLRVEIDSDGECVAYPGITALRLRPAAAALGRAIPGAKVTSAPDDRLAVRVNRTSADAVRLAAVLVPFPSRSAKRLEIQWLRPSLAAVELNQYPRVFDWKINGPLRRHFELSGDMAGKIPVGLMTVPWGPPWPSNVLDGILDLLSASAG